MTSKINQLLTDLQEQLSFIDLEIDGTLVRCEKAIEIILKSVEKLKVLFLKEKWDSEEKEIDFFKNIKPKFITKLIYYNIIYKIEAKMPYGGERVVKKYLNNELDKIRNYFYNNHDFNSYRRTGSIYLDNKYYVRGAIDIKLAVDSFYFEVDHNFATSHDFKLAKVQAHDLVQIYLESRLRGVDYRIQKDKAQVINNSKLTWTGNKSSLVELLYAMHTEKVLNNGTSDIKETAEYFEKIFNIDLGDYYRTFLEIRMRKNNKTKFLNSLTESLIKKMDEADEK